MGTGNRLLPFFIHEIERRGSQKGSRSVIGHIDLTFIIHLTRKPRASPQADRGNSHCRLLPSARRARGPADVAPRPPAAARGLTLSPFLTCRPCVTNFHGKLFVVSHLHHADFPRVSLEHQKIRTAVGRPSPAFTEAQPGIVCNLVLPSKNCMPNVMQSDSSMK